MTVLQNNHFKIIKLVPNMMRNRQVNMIYYNVLFTESEIIFDTLHQTFRPWLIHVKPFKNYVYENKNRNEILMRNQENFSVLYSQIKSMKIKDGNFIYNSSIKILCKDIIPQLGTNKIYLFNKQKLKISKMLSEIKEYLENNGISFIE